MTKQILIGIDQSTTSTSMTIDGKLYNYSTDANLYTTKGELTKWYAATEQYITFKSFSKHLSKNYSKDEIEKLRCYTEITNLIIGDILAYTNQYPGADIQIGIEGYSYGGDTSSILDLVCLGTLLRSSIIQNVTKNLRILAPTEVKKKLGQLVYPQNKEVKGKKNPITTYRNNDGIAAGSFDKHQMCTALIESNVQHDYIDYLRTNKAEILSAKKIFKPGEDTNDALAIYLIMLNNL